MLLGLGSEEIRFPKGFISTLSLLGAGREKNVILNDNNIAIMKVRKSVHRSLLIFLACHVVYVNNLSSLRDVVLVLAKRLCFAKSS